jgi:polyphosphate glucokinase
MEILGIDIGASGIKGAPVDTELGSLLAERYRLPTPEIAKPGPMIELIGTIASHFKWSGGIGCGFPGVIIDGITLTAANLHQKWVGLDAARQIAEKTACPVCLINDADAAGLAEMKFGAGRGHMGVVLIVTIGTGLGTALFTNGHLLPNSELGHIELGGEEAEWRASDAARKREELSWKKWGERFNRYLQELEKLVSPNLIILGGGSSKRFNEYNQYLKVRAKIVPAQLLNDAGIVGASLAAQDSMSGEAAGLVTPPAQSGTA